MWFSLEYLLLKLREIKAGVLLQIKNILKS